MSLSVSLRERLRALSRGPDRPGPRLPGALVPTLVVVLVAIGVAVWGLFAQDGSQQIAVTRDAPSSEASSGEASGGEAAHPDPTPDPGGDASGDAASGEAAASPLMVHVAGAVARPGLVRLAEGARVTDAIEAAGGLAGEADTDRVNLAAAVADGARIFVPERGQIVPSVVAGGAAASGGTSEAPVDVNTAPADQLTSLPGVGDATAEAIVRHREENGPFRSVDDLLGVRGIGPAKLEALRDRATV